MGQKRGTRTRGCAPKVERLQSLTIYMWIQDGKSRRQLNMPHAEPGSIHAWNKKLQHVSGNEGHTE